MWADYTPPPCIYHSYIAQISISLNLWCQLQCLGTLLKWTGTQSRCTTLRITEKGILATPLQTSAGRGLAVRYGLRNLYHPCRYIAVHDYCFSSLQDTSSYRLTLSESEQKPQGAGELTISIHILTSIRWAVQYDTSWNMTILWAHGFYDITWL